ncbi:peptidoglycan DD-metalloendopeptidase family protein [Acuticoccus sp.]|uniref:peptidoglycan DD-metalloendopeptidase family protein n=1 Tax=Acuticoccus sp. TaxID=1904378 RepID=UPI003B51B056
MRKGLTAIGGTTGRIAACASLAAFVAGCSANVERTAGTSLLAGHGGPATAGAPIESRDLAPLGYAPPGAMGTAGTPGSLRERGWIVEGAPIVTVSAGDTANSLSQGFGVPASIILEANGLMSAQEVRPGQRLVIPTYVYREADVATAAPTPAAVGLGAPPSTLAAQAAEGRHVVQPGETLTLIAAAHRVPQADLAMLNGLAVDAALTPGQRLRVPPAAVVVAAPAPAPPAPSIEPSPVAPSPEPVVAAAPDPSPQVAPVAAEAQAPTVTAAVVDRPQAPAAAAPAAEGEAGFRWPVRGRIIAGFGKQADGNRNDGINLSVPAGTAVHAAQDGTVIYAGDELEGYGNLILVQHEDDWVSAYAHNEALKVSRGDTVRRGQPIASVGATGSVDQPQLHFELRRKSKPVDPLPHLKG